MAGRVFTMEQLSSISGQERLRLVYEQCGWGADFHSLSFETRDSEGWLPRVVITREQFQGNSAYSRWVSELHSFSPASGTAIVQVAEGDRPHGSALRKLRLLLAALGPAK